jgi:hypothetical protein
MDSTQSSIITSANIPSIEEQLDFSSWYLSGEGKDPIRASGERYMKLHDLLLLNTICPCYHAGFGYDIYETFTTMEDSTGLGAQIWRDLADGYEDEDEDESYSVQFNLKRAKDMAQNQKLSHKIIVIRSCKRGKSLWIEKPGPVKKTGFDDHEVVDIAHDWYELPLREHKCKAGPYELPLSSRSYIHVTDPYDEVEIRSDEKDAPLTIDDVLFASRALCCGPDRSVNEFNIMSDNGSVLVLKANIDNWST